MSGTNTSTVAPLTMTAAGPQVTPPATLNQQLIAQAQAIVPGLTADLPGSLIDDIAGTDTGALIVIDQARVDYINSLSPLSANPYLLNQLGQIYGVSLGQGSNTSVTLVFSGPPGYVIPKGFIVSDGTYQYVTQTGGVIATNGQTMPLLGVATQTGNWTIAAGSVTQLVTEIPAGITPAVTVINPFPGTPQAAAQTEEQYRANVLQAGLCTAQGVPTFCKTLLNQINGVAANLVSIRQQVNGGWEVIVGGTGDPYLIGYAIFQAFGDIAVLSGSQMLVTGITNANPGVVTTNLNHGFQSAQTIYINGATGITGINGVALVISVINPTSFSVNLNTTALGTYTGNGVVTPNFRNVSTNIYDYPDTYTIPYVVPPSQTVSMAITWNTSAPNFTGAASVALAAQAAIVTYVNTLPSGQPMNLFELQTTFQVATASLVPTALLTRMVFAVSINGVGVSPTSGTGIIAGDPESYFLTTASSIVINQG